MSTRKRATIAPVPRNPIMGQSNETWRRPTVNAMHLALPRSESDGDANANLIAQQQAELAAAKASAIALHAYGEDEMGPINAGLEAKEPDYQQFSAYRRLARTAFSPLAAISDVIGRLGEGMGMETMSPMRHNRSKSGQ